MTEKIITTPKTKKREIFPIKNVHYIEIYTEMQNKLHLIMQRHSVLS